ncbi:MAG: AsmA family protein [Pseudomonadota bacterium]
MKKTLKIIAYLLVGLVTLLVVLAISLTILFDPNQYKGKLIEMVKNKTGRELTIDGKIGWSFFPWVGIETGRVEFGNAPGFGPEPFARIDGAGAKVELLPLLRKEVIVDTVFLDGLKLNLAKNAAGKTNWDDLTTPSKVEAVAEKTPAAGTPDIGGFGVNKIDVRKADITWNDQTSGARYAVHNLELQTGKIVVGQPVDAHLSFDLESGQPPLRTRVDLKTRTSLDLKAQTLDVTSLSLALAGLNLQASIKGNKIFDAPTFSGNIEAAPFSPRALMGKLGIKYETTDKGVLEKLSLKTRFAATGNSVELKDMNVGLDETRLNGSFVLRDFAKPAYRFDLALDQIDVDRYLPPAAPAATGAKAPDTAAPAKPVEIPLSALRALAIQGKLRVGKFKAMNIHSTDVLVQVTADSGLITLGPNEAKLYSGKYNGQTSLDVRGKTPALAINESVSGVQLAPMLKDAMQFDKFSGMANLSAKVTAQGLDAAQVKETLNGAASFSIQNGALKGIDLKKMEDTIVAAIKNKSIQNLKELPPKPSDETRFTQLGGSARIKNGVVTTDDTKLQSPDLLKVTAQGSADLPRETLDFKVSLGSYSMFISGPFSSPKFRPDTSSLVKAATEEKKTEAKEKLQQKLKDKFKLRR